MPENRGNLARNAFLVGLGLLLVVTIAAGAIELFRRPRTQLTRVMIGSRDEVYYYHAATRRDAAALGEALRNTGFLNDRGTTVLLSKGTAGTVVSFALNDAAWDHPDTVYSFEEIGRRIATSIGGFPIKVRLIDSKRILHKELAVGKVIIGARDAVYYFGAASEAEARSLGQALRIAGFFQDTGAGVVLSKGDGVGISFIVNDGVWERPDAVHGFERLVRQAAPSVGGLPVQLRLLNAGMEPKKSLTVE
jgi:hypothetical protein